MRRSTLPRYFTKVEAEELLPRIRPLMEEAQRQKLLLDEARKETEAIEARMKGNGADEDARRLAAKHEVLQALGRRLEELVDKVQKLGVEVKDLDMGLVDFRAQRGDSEYYLCWRVGESGIAWWHTLEGGFSGRQPL